MIYSSVGWKAWLKWQYVSTFCDGSNGKFPIETTKSWSSTTKTWVQKITHPLKQQLGVPPTVHQCSLVSHREPTSGSGYIQLSHWSSSPLKSQPSCGTTCIEGTWRQLKPPNTETCIGWPMAGSTRSDKDRKGTPPSCYTTNKNGDFDRGNF